MWIQCFSSFLKNDFLCLSVRWLVMLIILKTGFWKTSFINTISVRLVLYAICNGWSCYKESQFQWKHIAFQLPKFCQFWLTCLFKGFLRVTMFCMNKLHSASVMFLTSLKFSLSFFYALSWRLEATSARISINPSYMWSLYLKLQA
jgi:hypothetical protein